MEKTIRSLHIDEAGMGCWAGPLAVAGVVCDSSFQMIGLTDSKLLTKKQREACLNILTRDTRILFSEVKIVSADVINTIGLAAARRTAIAEIVTNCMKTMRHESIACLRIDGVGRESFGDLPTEYIVRGDRTVQGISAASIFAKVSRDRILQIELHGRHPEYGFVRNVGYGTAEHQAALETYGPCEEHRIWYKPLQKYVEQDLSETRQPVR